jgi:hypothetical protein
MGLQQVRGFGPELGAISCQRELDSIEFVGVGFTNSRRGSPNANLDASTPAGKPDRQV